MAEFHCTTDALEQNISQLAHKIASWVNANIYLVYRSLDKRYGTLVWEGIRVNPYAVKGA